MRNDSDKSRRGNEDFFVFQKCFMKIVPFAS